MNKQQFARLYLQGLLLQADKTDSRSRFRRGFVLLLPFCFCFFVVWHNVRAFLTAELK